MIKEPVVEDLIIPKEVCALKTKVIYGYDALCGWCYGFSEELNKAMEALDKEVDFELINAGLFAGVRGPKMGYMSAYIRRNMQYVTERTGKKFGPNFEKLLNNSDYYYNSMKASVAIEVIKDMAPKKVFDFSSKIQYLFFYEGKDIQSDKLYMNIAKDYDIDLIKFKGELYNDVYEKKAQESFYKAQQYGFKGYPASVIITGNQIKTLTEGFVSSNQLVSLIRKELGGH